MFDFLKFVAEQIIKGDRDNLSVLCAYVIAPLTFIVTTVMQLPGGVLSVESSQTFSITELKTIVTLDGTQTQGKTGTAIIVQPDTQEHRVRVLSEHAQIWTSLDEKGMRDNLSRLELNGNGISVRPFLGENRPVTIVVDGDISDDIQVPGGIMNRSEFVSSPGRATSFLLYVLLACTFAFGLALAVGFSPASGNQKATS